MGHEWSLQELCLIQYLSLGFMNGQYRLCSIQDLNLRDMNVSDGYMNDRLLDETSRVWCLRQYII